VTDKKGNPLRAGDVMFSERSPVMKAKVTFVDERVVMLQPRGGGGPVALSMEQLAASAWVKVVTRNS